MTIQEIDIKQALALLLEREDLTEQQMQSVMAQIMGGQATDAQIGAFLAALRMKGEVVEEIAGAVRVMRQLATPVKVVADNLVDVVGTGGDSAGIFNVSTASAFVVAAAGGAVAKHGNRSVSSNSGSADLLEKAGVKLDLSPDEIARCVQEVGIGFMFAVNHHSAMKYAIGPRREMAVRSIFNLLGPLTNPAGVSRLLLGVYSREWLRPVAEVLRTLGEQHIMVVHSADGLDEISIAAETRVAELRDGEITEYTLSPGEFGLELGELNELKVADAEESLAMVKRALSAEGGAASDMVALNAGAAIYVAGLANSMAQGVAMAQDAIGSGLARNKLNELATFTSCLGVE